jgi:hypothetical protein
MKASYDNSIYKIPIDYKIELMLLIKKPIPVMTEGMVQV